MKSLRESLLDHKRRTGFLPGRLRIALSDDESEQKLRELIVEYDAHMKRIGMKHWSKSEHGFIQLFCL